MPVIEYVIAAGSLLGEQGCVQPLGRSTQSPVDRSLSRHSALLLHRTLTILSAAHSAASKN
jgi:hypothetical protein